MSNRALAFSSAHAHVSHTRSRRRTAGASSRRPLRAWSEVAVAGTRLQTAIRAPAHIKAWHFLALVAAVLVAHTVVVYYFAQHRERPYIPHKAEISLDIVRPPKPPEPPKVEPPKPPLPQAPPKQARVLPQIQQSEPLPNTVGESTEPPIAVAPVAAEAPPPLPPEPVTEPIGRAGYLNNPAPEYPTLAARQGWQGTVLLRVHVRADGSVEAVEIKQSSGRRVLDDEAVQTVKRWSFTPAKRGTAPIDGWATVPIEFLLDQ